MKIFIGFKNKPENREIKKKIHILFKNLSEEITKDPKIADLSILIGGDGTFLYWQNRFGCPIFGIKTNGIGYYMSASKKNYLKKIEKICRGKMDKDYFIHKYLKLEAHLNKKLLPSALNEYLISSGYTRKIFNSKLKIGDKEFSERNSGIIVYTPTGTTAFAGSCGAEKLNWNENKFGVIGIAPYSGRLRKGEILLNKRKIIIECLNKNGEICIDGQEKYTYKIKKGDRIIVEKSKNFAKVIRF